MKKQKNIEKGRKEGMQEGSNCQRDVKNENAYKNNRKNN